MAKWQGTQVPNSGYVENIYLNTALSVDEVVSLLEKLTYNADGQSFLLSPNNDNRMYMVMFLYGIYGIGEMDSQTMYFVSDDMGAGFVGWNTNITYPIVINAEVDNSISIPNIGVCDIGTQNNLLTELFSTTPFTQSTTADKLQKLIDGKQYVVDKTNAKAGTSLNIKSKWKELGDTIDGIESGIDTTDSTATASDIRIGKTAYVGTGKISGTIEDYDGAYEGEAVNEVDSIIDNTIENLTTNVETIVDYKMRYCTTLKSVNAPNVKTIGQSAFQGCTALESVNAPNAITINAHGFYRCSPLKNIDFPLVTTLGQYCFQECVALESANLPSVVTMNGNVFNGCSSLKNIDLPLLTTFKTSNDFINCTALESANLPLVTTIYGGTFWGCKLLTNLYLGYEGVVTLNNTNGFSGCKNVTVHVRADYADQYASATNWSSLIANGTITIVGDYSD